MFRFSKDMLNLFEEYLRRKEGLPRFEGTYANPDDTDTKGRPKTKPFVPGSLRFPRGLNHSKRVKNDGQVGNIFNSVLAKIEAGNSEMEELKNRLAACAKRIADLEIEVRVELMGISYNNVMYFIAGGLLIKMKKEAKQSRGYVEPTNSTPDMAVMA